MEAMDDWKYDIEIHCDDEHCTICHPELTKIIPNPSTAIDYVEAQVKEAWDQGYEDIPFIGGLYSGEWKKWPKGSTSPYWCPDGKYELVKMTVNTDNKYLSFEFKVFFWQSYLQHLVAMSVVNYDGTYDLLKTMGITEL